MLSNNKRYESKGHRINKNRSKKKLQLSNKAPQFKSHNSYSFFVAIIK